MPDSEKMKSIEQNSDHKVLPDYDDLFQWQTNRRTLLKAAVISGALSQFSFLQSCETENEITVGNEFMNEKQMSVLKSVLNILFPDDGNGPSIQSLNTINYILWVLRDSGASQKNKNYLIEGVDWADETALEKSGRNYLDLDQSERERAIKYYTETAYGKEWCSIMLTLILESLVLDPIYGGNSNEAGWKWLEITPGFPRADEKTRYENVLETARSEYPKSAL